MVANIPISINKLLNIANLVKGKNNKIIREY